MNNQLALMQSRILTENRVLAELVGKTISSAEKVELPTDDENILVLTFTDGSSARFIGWSTEYYTGKSEGEYPQFLSIAYTPSLFNIAAYEEQTSIPSGVQPSDTPTSDNIGG